MDPQAQLDGFLAKFTPQVAAEARSALARMKALVPGAAILVYDNYNALAIGFAPGERAGQAILSLAVFPKWVTLCFLRGTGLPDPHGLLKGAGSRVRHIRLAPPETIDDPRVLALIGEALARAEPPIDPAAPGRLVIKSVSAKQRPRRPPGV
jgi:hypothetical protein